MNHIDTMLQELGIPMDLKGYKALRVAISIAVENPLILETITKGLYPAVAEKIGSTGRRTERAMRHAIEVGFERCPVSVMQKYFGNSISATSAKPSNSQFIATVAAYASERDQV